VRLRAERRRRGERNEERESGEAMTAHEGGVGSAQT
jgi:hypothetical protein